MVEESKVHSQDLTFKLELVISSQTSSHLLSNLWFRPKTLLDLTDRIMSWHEFWSSPSQSELQLPDPPSTAGQHHLLVDRLGLGRLAELG